MTPFRPASVLATLAVLSAVPALRADETAEELKALTGTWQVEKATLRGEDSTGVFQAVTLKMEAGKYTVDFAGQEDKGTISLDLKAKPRRMKVESKEGLNQGKTFPAVYELAKDTLTVCYDLDGKDYPAGLESKTGTSTFLIVYKRDKK